MEVERVGPVNYCDLDLDELIELGKWEVSEMLRKGGTLPDKIQQDTLNIQSEFERRSLMDLWVRICLEEDVNMDDIKSKIEPDTMDKIAAFTMGQMARGQRWYHSGSAVLSGLFWLAFIATLFLLMLGLVPLDRISGWVVVIFGVMGLACSLTARGE